MAGGSHWQTVLQQEMGPGWQDRIEWNKDLAEFTTFCIGGPAEAIVRPRDPEELVQLVKVLARLAVPWQVLGRGSNVLVADDGLEGVVIVFGRNFARRRVVEEGDSSVLVRVEAGHSLAALVNWHLVNGLSGLEFAVGIPGSIGGAIVMNAGAWGGEIADLVVEVGIMDRAGALHRCSRQDIDFGYRSWGQPKGQVVVDVVLSLGRDIHHQAHDRVLALQKRRQQSQPRGVANAGSVFKNPANGLSAGRLIEEAGLKGFAIGGAMVSEVHANFIVNAGRARAADVVELMLEIQGRVEKHSGVRLEPEIKVLGRVKPESG